MQTEGNPAGVQVASPVSNDELIKLATMNRDHVEGQINLADTKAQLALIADALLGTYIFAIGKSDVLKLFDARSNLLVRLGTGSLLIAFVALFLSVLFSLLVALPELGSQRQSSESLFYFGSIASRNEAQFIADFTRQSDDEMRNMILYSLYAKAIIAEKKFHNVRWSIVFLIVTLFALIFGRVVLILT